MIKLDEIINEILSSEISSENKQKERSRENLEGKDPFDFDGKKLEPSLVLFNENSFLFEEENKTLKNSEFLFKKDEVKFEEINSNKLNEFKFNKKEEKKFEFNFPLQVNKLENEKKMKILDNDKSLICDLSKRSSLNIPKKQQQNLRENNSNKLKRSKISNKKFEKLINPPDRIPENTNFSYIKMDHLLNKTSEANSNDNNNNNSHKFLGIKKFREEEKVEKDSNMDIEDLSTENKLISTEFERAKNPKISGKKIHTKFGHHQNNNFNLIKTNNNKYIMKKKANESIYLKRNIKNKKLNKGRWSQKEHRSFIEAIIKYGNSWKKVQQLILTRSSSQARSHAQKFFFRIKKEFKINSNISFESFTLFSKFQHKLFNTNQKLNSEEKINSPKNQKNSADNFMQNNDCNKDKELSFNYQEKEEENFEKFFYSNFKVPKNFNEDYNFNYSNYLEFSGIQENKLEENSAFKVITNNIINEKDSSFENKLQKNKEIFLNYLYNLNNEIHKNESFSFTKEMKDFILKEFIVINDNPKIDDTNFNPDKLNFNSNSKFLNRKLIKKNILIRSKKLRRENNKENPHKNNKKEFEENCHKNFLFEKSELNQNNFNNININTMNNIGITNSNKILTLFKEDNSPIFREDLNKNNYNFNSFKKFEMAKNYLDHEIDFLESEGKEKNLNEEISFKENVRKLSNFFNERKNSEKNCGEFSNEENKISINIKIPQKNPNLNNRKIFCIRKNSEIENEEKEKENKNKNIMNIGVGNNLNNNNKNDNQKNVNELNLVNDQKKENRENSEKILIVNTINDNNAYSMLSENSKYSCSTTNCSPDQINILENMKKYCNQKNELVIDSVKNKENQSLNNNTNLVNNYHINNNNINNNDLKEEYKGLYVKENSNFNLNKKNKFKGSFRRFSSAELIHNNNYLDMKNNYNNNNTDIFYNDYNLNLNEEENNKLNNEKYLNSTKENRTNVKKNSLYDDLKYFFVKEKLESETKKKVTFSIKENPDINLKEIKVNKYRKPLFILSNKKTSFDKSEKNKEILNQNNNNLNLSKKTSVNSLTEKEEINRKSSTVNKEELSELDKFFSDRKSSDFYSNIRYNNFSKFNNKEENGLKGNFEENINNPFSLEFNIDSYEECLSNSNKENNSVENSNKNCNMLEFSYFNNEIE